jgi:cytochrome P450
MSQMLSAHHPPHSARRPLPPGPRGQFFWGMLGELRRDMLGLYRSITQQYGDFVRLPFAGVDTFAISHPDYFKHVLQDNNKNYVRNEFFNRIITTFVGLNLFTADSDDWLSRRRLMQPAFHRQRIAGFSTTMTGAVLAMLSAWDQRPDGQRLELDHELMQLTLRVAGQTLFSRDLIGEANALGEAFTATSEYVNYRLGHPFVLPPIVPTAANRKFTRAQKVLDRAIDEIIRARRASGEDQPDLLSMLMNARDEDTGLGMDDQSLHNEVAVMLFAGHETTAAALTWAFYLLSQNPAVEQRLHGELAEVLGGRTPTLEDLPRLRYNRMVIDETLRLYPPAWGITRQSVGPDEFGGYRLPPKASLTLVINNVHHDPRFWDNPECFDPERFLPERSANRPHFAYLPFGGGPRQCIGNQFALTEAQLVLATVAQRYQLRLVPDHPVRPNPIFVLRTSHGLPVSAHRR